MSAKDLLVKPISAQDANHFVRALHYSGKVVPNSQLHLGVYWNDRLHGVMQFGPPLKKKNNINLISGTAWNGFIELNRLAFDEQLPRNSESRAISVAMRLLKKHYPHIEWVLSFADGTQCGDGTIYRASGFVLTDIRHSKSLRRNPETGEVMHAMQAHHKMIDVEFRGWDVLPGFQLRYIYFINKAARQRLTVPIIPFSKIEEMGIGMYKGVKRSKQAMAGTTGTAAGQHRPGRSKLEASNGRTTTTTDSTQANTG